MAAQKIFLTKAAEHECFGESVAMTYSFDTERKLLTVFRKDKIVDQRKARLGQAFIVKGTGQQIRVIEMQIPIEKVDFLMWIFSISKDYRFYSLEELNEFLDIQRKGHNYMETEVTGEKYKIIFRGKECMAAFIEESIGKEDILELLVECGKVRKISYPIPFVRMHLWKRFKISPTEIKAGTFTCVRE